MRLTVEQAERMLHVDADRLVSAIDSGLIHVDMEGAADFQLIVAWKLATSDAAHALFGDSIQLPAPEVAYVVGVDESSIRASDRVGEAFLESRAYGISESGRTIVQTVDVAAWAKEHGGEVSDKDRGVMVLLRENDTSSQRALQDAYLLGDSRLTFAVEQLINGTVRESTMV